MKQLFLPFSFRPQALAMPKSPLSKSLPTAQPTFSSQLSHPMC
jgi:hypothetical protein